MLDLQVKNVKKWQRPPVQGTSIWYNCVNHWRDHSISIHILTNHFIPEQLLNLSVVSGVPAVESMAFSDELSPLSAGADNYKFYENN